jgi:hypothetical protein
MMRQRDTSDEALLQTASLRSLRRLRAHDRRVEAVFRTASALQRLTLTAAAIVVVFALAGATHTGG